MQEEKSNVGLGVNVGVDVNLQGLESAVGMLTNALKQTGDTATQLIGDAVRKIREAGAPKLKEASQGGDSKVKNAYERTVSELQKARDKGNEEAKKLLSEMGQ